MRLINCSTLELEEYFGDNIPRYAILSHTWGADEVSFADFTRDQAAAKLKEGYLKINHTCEQAIADGLAYVWVDTCCIDKSSSAELSEAINSMYGWYGRSAVCYAYLSDVTGSGFDSTFRTSRWFTRGWTLQELLAPKRLKFMDKKWTFLGTRQDYVDQIAEITAIERSALLGLDDESNDEIENRNIFRSFCVAQRMSWASRRKTTRVEDAAYSLLGLFGINMPLLYGEGKKAFVRLQEEIMRNFDDVSILAWGLDPSLKHPQQHVPALWLDALQRNLYPSSLLACSPKDFENCGSLKLTSASHSAFNMTNQGLQIELYIVPMPDLLGQIGLLGCSANPESGMIGIIISPPGNWGVRLRCATDTYGLSHTVLVGAKHAAQSSLQKITIAGDEPSYLRTRERVFQKFIINQSLAFESMGYQPVTGEGFDVDTIHQMPSMSIWNDELKELTYDSWNSPWSLMPVFSFQHRSLHQDEGFTLCVHPDNKKTFARWGSLSLNERQDIYHLLGERTRDDDFNYQSRTIGFTSSDGKYFQLQTKITEKKVYHWHIFEIDVDFVETPSETSVETPVEVPEDTSQS